MIRMFLMNSSSEQERNRHRSYSYTGRLLHPAMWEHRVGVAGRKDYMLRLNIIFP